MADSKTSQAARAALVLFLATWIWGASFIFMKALGLAQEHLIPGAGTWFISALSLLVRFGVSAVLMACWAGKRLATATRAELVQGLALGSFGGIGILFQMDGVQHTAASTSAFLTQCYTVFIPVVLAIHRRKPPRKTLMACCVMVMAGVGVLGNIDWRQFRLGRGELESFLGSVLFTGQILCLERRAWKSNRNSVVSSVMFTTIALLMLPVALATGNGLHDWTHAYASFPAAMLIMGLTLGGTLAAYGIMNYWQPHVPATQAGLIYCCEPLLTSIFALFLPSYFSTWCGIDYPNEKMTTSLLIGGGLITGANLIALLFDAATEKRAAPES